MQERGCQGTRSHAGEPGTTATTAYLHVIRGCLTIDTACFQELGHTIQCTFAIVLNHLIIVKVLNMGIFAIFQIYA